MKYLVAYHDPAILDALEVPGGTTKLYLNNLPLPGGYQQNRFAESRALLYLALNPNEHIPPSGYMGLFQASYPTKFPALPPLTHLGPFYEWSEVAPFNVHAPVVGPNYLEQADVAHPGMRKVLETVLYRAGIPLSHKPSIFCNSFIAHVSVWKEFLTDWLRMFLIAQDYVNPVTYDVTLGNSELAPAYLLERLTAAWFAAIPRVHIYSIPSAEGLIYTPKYEFDHERAIASAK